MMIIAQFSVTLAIFAKKEDGTLITVIQQRGPWDHEKQKPQSFAGAWQPAAHGKTESIQETLIRETTEELGESFAQAIKELPMVALEGETSDIDKKEQVLHFVCLVPYESLAQIQVHLGASNLKEITMQEAGEIQTLTKEDRAGVDPDGPVKMFADDRETLLAGFRQLAS